MSSSVQYEESIRREFVRPVRSRTKGELVFVRLVRRIKQVGLRPSGTKSRETKACPHSHDGIKDARLHLASMKSREWSASPRQSGTKNQARGTLFVQDEVARKESLYSSDGMRNQVSGTSSVRYKDARMENLSSSVQDKESITQEFVRPMGSRTKGNLVLVRLVRGIMQAGLCLSGTKSCETKACPRPCEGIVHARLHPASMMSCKRSSSLRPSSMRNQVSGTSSI